MQDEGMREAIFHYVQDLVSKNGTIMMGIGALTLFVGLNAVLIFLRDSTGSAILMIGGAIFLPFAYHRWFRNFFRLARFTVGIERNYRVVEVGISPLNDVTRFEAIPKHYVDDADETAPPLIVEEIREMSLAFNDLREKLEHCESSQGRVTRYDAANLLLLQEGLRAARTPGYCCKIEIPETLAAKEQTRSPTPRI
ncbi:MAG: hypothetical protein AAF420_00315 [Pseudomonadota bacterium]